MVRKRKSLLKRVVMGVVAGDMLLMAQGLVFRPLHICNLLHQTLQNKQCHISANAASICVSVRQSVLLMFCLNLPQARTVSFQSRSYLFWT
jgi:hypothetical protein